MRPSVRDLTSTLEDAMAADIDSWAANPGAVVTGRHEPVSVQRCRSCRTALGRVENGVLAPSVPGVTVDRRGMARVPCPQCGAARVWKPVTLDHAASAAASRNSPNGPAGSAPSAALATASRVRPR